MIAHAPAGRLGLLLDPELVEQLLSHERLDREQIERL
jgi:hypothetical protein